MSSPHQTIVVAGASSGLGAALTLLHAKRGDHVVAIARRKDRLNKLAQKGGKVLPLELDISLPNAPRELFAFLGETFSVARLYAIAAVPPPQNPDLETLQAYVNLSYTTWPWWFQSLREVEALTASSHFVIVSSLAASIPFPGLEHYSACKAALEAWTRCAREGFPGRISIVRPGHFCSEFHQGPSPLDFDALPHERARMIVELLDRGRDEIILGGWRDVIASRFSNVISPVRLRRMLFGS